MTQPLGSPPAGAPRKPNIEVSASRHFFQWLEGAGASLAITTYHSNRLFLIGVKEGERLSVFQRVFERAMGLAASSDELLLATRFQLWRFVNVLRPGELDGDCDRHYKPHLAWTTGDLDIHDTAFDADGDPIFVNTLFGCIATVDSRHSFRPIWRPPFLSRLVPEDRCHLNGMAMEDGRPRYVTACSRSDVASGWRDRRHDGGVVIDVESGEIVLDGLSMPHSPRLHDGKLWLLNSGTGELGTVDLARGVFEPVCFCPGYLRGLTFHRGFALVGMSRCREERTFSGLELDDRLSAKQAEAKCGVAVIELATGSLVHWLEFAGEMRELYDVQLLPGVRCPRAYGLQSKDIWGVATHEMDGRVVRHSGVVRD